ncbi:(2Fe-2S)-binding protein [Actinacidiphila sp. DG2A-62]|uniref:(2Fe-2S)-binding protein n=1 Tax=Actinacidiphila sp. DG2A-62 TaxID=3108821 RepID=UPI002DBE22C4|nr:(2Fe-2S)-binding protein [Actinacidiphila sp. DG2A-62]MEC3992209.1 (2Fe-2S)-binding protein [Actinacidiphila sp. DG2A-62]
MSAAAALLAGLGPFFAVEIHEEGAGTGAGPDPGASAGANAGLGPDPGADADPGAGTDADPGAQAERRVAPGPGAAAWRSMGELADGSPVLGDRIAAVRGTLAAGGGQPPEEVEVRVAASVTHLGLAARVLSPYLALAVLDGWAPDPAAPPALAAHRWQPVLGGPYPLSLPRPSSPRLPDDRQPPRGAPAPGPEARPAPPSVPETARDAAGPPGRPSWAAPAGASARDAAGLAAAFAASVLDGPVRELSAPFAAFGLSGHILRGNIASALHGAAGMIAAARPDAAARAGALTALLLDRPPLTGASGRTAAGAFRRRSCCLIYRAAPGRAGALCGDCVLRGGRGDGRDGRGARAAADDEGRRSGPVGPAGRTRRSAHPGPSGRTGR